MHVLFLGKGNDCRTLLAEAIFNHLAPPGYTARRASCDHAGTPDPAALRLLAKQGIQPALKTAESPLDSPSENDVLITVCSVGAEQTCPCCRPNALRAHWASTNPPGTRGFQIAATTNCSTSITFSAPASSACSSSCRLASRRIGHACSASWRGSAATCPEPTPRPASSLADQDCAAGTGW